MPYISQAAREELDSEKRPPETSGELNYVITTKLIEYVLANGYRYSIFNDVLGALEGAKEEFYSRVVAEYEDRKIEQNGDVYGELFEFRDRGGEAG